MITGRAASASSLATDVRASESSGPAGCSPLTAGGSPPRARPPAEKRAAGTPTEEPPPPAAGPPAPPPAPAAGVPRWTNWGAGECPPSRGVGGWPPKESIPDLPVADPDVARAQAIRLKRMQGRAASDPPPRREPSAATSWWPAIRIVASGVMLALLLPRMHLPSLLPPGHHGDTIVYLLLGLLTTLGGIVLSAWRWQRGL